MGLDNIDNIRSKIDTVNLQILELLNMRALLVKEIVELKDKAGIDYFDPVREEEMLRMILEYNKGPIPNELVKEVFQSILKTALEIMNLNRENRLLVSSKCSGGFLNISEMFDVSPGKCTVIAGPCAVENHKYLEATAKLLNEHGIKFLRGGAFKPRTSPYDFQGLKEEGLKILSEVGKEYGLITVTEVIDTRDVETVSRYAGAIQIGARNMQNFALLKEAGNCRVPVILKRGMSSTIQELVFAAEYIALQGSKKIILCERGIRTFENKTRNTLDISCIPIIKKETSLPVIVDLSHSLGRKDIINSIACASIAAGADGIMVEVHPYPQFALSDSKQQLNHEEFVDLLHSISGFPGYGYY